MKNLKQDIIKFNYDKNFRNEDFYVSTSNKHILDLFNNWPNWEKNFVKCNWRKLSLEKHI